MHFLNHFRNKKQISQLNDHSALSKVFDNFAIAQDFFQKFFNFSIIPSDFHLSLQKFAKKYNFLNAAILFAQIFEYSLGRKIQKLSPLSFHSQLELGTHFFLLDIREEWEKQIAPFSHPKTTEITFEKIRKELTPQSLIIVIDHFGVKSIDACFELQNCGFEKTFALEGGIHRWASEIDPSLPQYDGPAC